MNKKTVFEGLLFLLMISIAGLLLMVNYDQKRYIEKEIINKDTLKETSLEDSIVNYLLEIRIKYPEIVLSQIKLETGNLKSKIFRGNNNLFGMKLPLQRSTTCIGIKDGYALYRDWKMSILDYAIYQGYYFKGLSKEEYYKKLSEIYSENKLYIKQVQKIENSLTNGIYK